MATTQQMTSDFPVDWNTIDDGDGPFSYDPMHFPHPVSPLTASTCQFFGAGHTAGHRSLGLPEREYQVRVVNHYRYDRVLMKPAVDETEVSAEAKRAETIMQREVGRQLDRWYIEHRPRLLELHARLRQMHPRGQGAPTVLRMLDEADAIQLEGWTIHFTLAPSMMLSMQLLREFHADLFGDDGDGALTLMAGNLSESIKAGFGLADLAQQVRDLGLVNLVLTTPVETLLPALQDSEQGRAFMAELDAYLEDYGLRQDMFDLATPTWRESPTVVLAIMRSYLETGHDPRAEHAKVAQAAEAAFEAARARLAAYPGSVWEQFEQLVQFARQGAFVQEEHNFYIDQRLLSLLRLFYLEIGDHLRDLGLLDRADDVFMLQLGEIRDLVGNDAPAMRAAETRMLVATRREEVARAAAMTPPPTIGATTDAPPLPDTPMTRSLAAFFGWGSPQPAVDGQLRGTPGSRGIASGPARIARTLEEARAVRPGEILVAVTTMPAWTPLFGVAAGVVTETGGPLSHCAIVAREYGIPAVVGARGATRTIQTGQRVTVDGVAGVVTIDS